MKKKSAAKTKGSEFTRALATVRNTRGGLYRGFAKLRLYSEPDLLRQASAEFAKLPAYKLFTSRAPFPRKPEDLAGSGFHYLGNFSRELAWLAGLFSAHGSTIARFVEMRDQFEHHYLHGDYSAATIVLDEVEQACGFSIWLLQRRMDVSAQMHGASARNRVLTELLGEGGPTSIHYIMAWFTYRSAAAVSRSEYERFLREASASPRPSQLILYADAGVYLTIDPAQAATMLSYTDVMALVDRYQFALATAAILLGGGAAGTAEAQIVREHLCSLRRTIPDPLLSRLALATGDRDATCCPHAAMLDLVDSYSTGKYNDIISRFQPGHYAACSTEALAIALRACICLRMDSAPIEQWGIDPKSILGRVATDLFEVLRFGPRGIDARLRLSKLILVHASQQWTASLSLILERQQHDERVSSPNREQRIAALRTSCDHPIIAFCLGDDQVAAHYLEHARQVRPDSPTINSLLGVLTNTEKDLPLIAADRSRHVDGLRLLRAGEHICAAEVLTKLANDTSSVLLRREASLLLVACHLHAGDIASAADLAANLFVEERYFGIVLPIRSLISGLMAGHDLPLAGSPTRGRISAAIVFDIYSRFVAADRDAERADAFNDVIRRYEVQKASELPRLVEGASERQLIYFLRYICIPEVLDQSLLLDTTKSVEDERLAILLALTEMPNTAGLALDAYKEEMREIRTRQIVRDTALKLDQSKIYVNVDGIRRSMDVEMRENWARYKFMVANGGDLNFSDAEKLLISGIDQNQNVVMVRLKTSPSERYSLFKRIVSEVRDQFTANKEYGLNSNLSANIRHGYVLRELRGPLVNRNLVTNLISGERGYHPNSYWAERLDGSHLDAPETLDAFQREMSTFSEAVDRAIERLNRHLLRIRSEASPQGLFNYNLSESALAVLDRSWGEIETYDEFMDSIFESMWTATDHNLKNVRSELGTTVLQHFISEIDALSARLDSLGITRALPTISDAITMARTDMRAAVDRVASWFTLSPHHEYADFDLEIPLRAGLATVAATETDLDLTHSYAAKPSSIMLQGWSLPSFGRLFFQLLDNAAKHGGHDRDALRISVSAEAEGGSLLIRVENDLPDNLDLDHLNERVAQLNAEYGQAKALDMIGEEGGSGYSKIWKLIRADLKRDAHDISVEVVDRCFVVSLLMNS